MLCSGKYGVGQIYKKIVEFCRYGLNPNLWQELRATEIEGQDP